MYKCDFSIIVQLEYYRGKYLHDFKNEGLQAGVVNSFGCYQARNLVLVVMT